MRRKSIQSAPRAGRKRRRSSAFTLVELILSAGITTLIGAAIASLFFAVSYGTASRNDMRALVPRQRTIVARLDASIRSSRMVLAIGSNFVVLWMADTRANSAPNLSELRRIEFDSTNKTVTSYKVTWPAGWSQAMIDAADTQYTLGDDFGVITAALKGNSYFPPETWSRSVSTWSLTANKSSVQTATMVSYQITTVSGQTTNTLIGAAALRSP